ncbi:MAG: hypothetical protein K8R36_08470 [Planctomycetales bacterium]|nr:hypothetical protein [Planctomycetales bacterium]
MHVRDLVELAARIAVSSSAERRPVHDPKGRSIQTYWSAARCRAERWTRAIRRQGEMILRGEITSREAWVRFEPLFEEILASELVSRIAAAAAAAYDSRRKTAELEPVARSVFTAHLEVRSKVLQLLLTGERHGVAAAKKLNDFRRRVERWTDLLLAHFASAVCVHDFAFEPNRSADFADDLKSGGTFDEQHLARELLFSSFRNSLLSQLSGASPNADLNETIGRSLSALFYEDNEQSVGESAWLARISQMTDDAQEMLDEIVAMEAV